MQLFCSLHCNLVLQLLQILSVLFNLQRHDIFKKRLDSHGDVIEARQDGIGAPKVSDCLKFISLVQRLHKYILYTHNTRIYVYSPFF